MWRGRPRPRTQKLFRDRLLLPRSFRRRNPPLRLGRSRRRSAVASGDRFTAFAALRQNQCDVRNAALVAVRASLRRRTNALHARTVVGDRTLYEQVVDVHVEILFGAEKI